MHIHQSVYVRISSSIFVCISNSISVRIFVCISSSIRSRCRSRCRSLGHGAVTVASHSPAPARGRCTFAARSLRQVCRAAAQGTSQNSIRSGLRDRTAAARGNLERRALKCHCALKCHDNLGWRMAVVHEVTAEQRRPSDVEKMRSLSNRHPLMRKRSRIFWNQLHTEIQAQKNQRSRLQSY